MVTFGRKATAAVMAGLMTVGIVAPATTALAENTPSAGSQTGTGQTDLTMILEDTGEHGGTEDLTNPDSNNDGLGDNLAFTVPTSVNYVVKADGDLLGPSAGAAFIENRSNFKTHVSSVQVNNNGASGASGFTFVSDVDTDTASASPTSNAVELHFGPAADQLNAASYTSKAAVTTPAAWNMAATNGAHTANSDRGDEVQLTTSGKVARISEDITAQTKFGEIHWYLTPGEASDSVELHTMAKSAYSSSEFTQTFNSVDDLFPMCDGQTYAFAVTDSFDSAPDFSEATSLGGTAIHEQGMVDDVTWGEFLEAFHLTPADVNGKCVWLWINT